MLFHDPLIGSVLAGRARPAALVPPTDVVVSDGDLVVTMDVPGVTPESLEIELLGDQLFVRGERAGTAVRDGAQWAHAERASGRFERRVRVPAGVDADRIAASLDAGVLSLIVPKPDRLRPRRIAIDTRADQRELETTPA